MEYSVATISIAFCERKKRIHDNADRFAEESEEYNVALA